MRNVVRVRAFVFLAVAIITGSVFAHAQAPKAVTQSAAVTETAVIVAIDATNRLISLKGDDGVVDTIFAGPDVQRFSELKVGDKVTFRYYESVVYAIQQPGEKPPAPESIGIVRNTGPRPGGTMSNQMTAVVTIKAIDMKVPSVTITTADGSTVSFKVEEPKNLTGVKVGDKVQITYTRALAISVEAPKK